MTRLEANRKILEKISKIVEEYPDWRFHQVLQNIGCTLNGTDQWFEEPELTLKRIEWNEVIASSER